MTPTLPPLTEAEVSELRRLAGVATPGPWIDRECANYEHLRDVVAVADPNARPYPACASGRDAAYIAAASPDRLLRLLEERERLRDALGLAADDFQYLVETGWSSLAERHALERVASMRAALAATGHADPAGEEGE